MNKRGIEFSVGFLVGLIIAILIFSLSLYFVFKWFGEAEELKGDIDRQTQDRIMSTLKAGNQQVGIPISVVEVKRGDLATFGLGVRNIGNTADFSASVSFAGAYDEKGNQLAVENQFITTNWLGQLSTIPLFTLNKNEMQVVPIIVKAGTQMGQGINTQKGDYVFNVCVWQGTAQECSISKRNEVFTQKIYQVTVRVI
jgi:hypothetical protein